MIWSYSSCCVAVVVTAALCTSSKFVTGFRASSPLRSLANLPCRAKGDGDQDKELNHEEIKRYSRHLVLGDVGMKGQKQLKNASVLVIGAGGLGSPCLLYLAAAGIGTLGIVDADTVDESNLQRQIIHGTSTVGVSKCQSAMQRILDVNPTISVLSFEEEFTSQTAMRIVTSHPWDVVVDGSDNFPTKYLINDVCEMVNLPWVYSAILGFEGQLSVFQYQGGPTYRDLLPQPPPPGDVPSCAEGGVLGVLPGAMGCLQATEVLKLILDKPGICSGRLLVYDALEMKFTNVGLERLPAEKRQEVTELIDYQGFCAGHLQQQQSQQDTTTMTTNAPGNGGRTMDEAEGANDKLQDDAPLFFHTISPREALAKLAVEGWTPYVLDVRLPTEHEIVALPFTDRVVPHRTVSRSDVPVEGDVLVYCKAGVRGKKACLRLISEFGLDGQRLYNLEGGIMKWQKEVDPSMPVY